MSKKEGKKGFFAIKIDLTKAYDKLNWEFIWRTLVEIKLPDNMINFIVHGVSSVETNVNWNGNRVDFFRPCRGIRQGDPISPYLCVLCLDKLSHLIEHEVNIKSWRTMRLGTQGINISHLMFADDLLLFGEASENQMMCVKKILHDFFLMSGQEISKDKSSIPLKGKILKKGNFNYIIEQVSMKLSGWKARHLSFAGRMALAKSVMEAIPIYSMMTNLLLKACIKDIQKLQRNFIWGDTEDSKNYHALLDHGKWKIGNEADVRAWYDCWIEDGKDILDYNVNIPMHLQNSRVKDLMDAKGDWDWNIMECWLPDNLKQKIAAIVSPSVNATNDQFRVASEENGLCTVPERVRYFIWLMNNDRLMTNYRKISIGIGGAASLRALSLSCSGMSGLDLTFFETA
ncbi:uncharacterized protein LOC131614008 [Vicia villosa]|uniref:uncharacterized protein LOC131614008 n=1 Tax=Vicia villosa TaxID=3911 RepID=UPI00273C0359|nr:uncharacterized protein LOC131614008 [Vicia villosa]